MGHPFDSLNEALLKSGREALFAQSLLVLPEAFNIIEGYYPPPNPGEGSKKYVADADVEKKLAELSSKLGLCFVVGLIRNSTGEGSLYTEAILLDGDLRKVLSRKTLCDTSRCYTPFTRPWEDVIISHRGLSIGAPVFYGCGGWWS